MGHKISDFVEVSRLETLLNIFYSITGIPSGIICSQDGIIANSTWNKLCTEFHRSNKTTYDNCIKSEKKIIKKINEKKDIVMSICQNGMADIDSPIIIDNKVIATVFLCQFFYEDMDLNFQKELAYDAGFDIEKYMDAVRETPVKSKSKVENSILF